MSWILRKKKQKLAILAIVFLFTSLWYLAISIWVLLVLYSLNARIRGVFYSVNNRIASIPCSVFAILHDRRNIAKINTLIIGDTCLKEVAEQYIIGNSLAVQFPGRSLEASYQIFMHIESVLEEQGRLVVFHDDKTDQHKLTIFDLPYLHAITIKELKMEGWEKKARYPLVYEPVRSIDYIRGLQKTGYQIDKCPDEKLTLFCKERNIDFLYLNRR